MWSGALNGFNPLSSLLTPFQLTFMLGMLGYGLGPLSGRELISLFVKQTQIGRHGYLTSI